MGPSPVLVDDPGHVLDLTARVRAVFDVVFGDEADGWWSEVGAVIDSQEWGGRAVVASRLLRPPPEDVLQVASEGAGLVAGRYQVGFVSGVAVCPPDHERQLCSGCLRMWWSRSWRLSSGDCRNSRRSSGRKRPRRSACSLAPRQALVDELIELRDELRAVAPLWHPDLNELITGSLRCGGCSPTTGPGRTNSKSRWMEFVKGEYDGAQLAMHIWPERVIPKARGGPQLGDRSRPRRRLLGS